MKIVLAPDKFKGSLTGLEFCQATQKGLLKVIPDADIVFMPMADGGDGTIEVVNYYLKGDFVQIQVKNPLFQDCTATFLYAKDSKIAFIEMAEASGLKLLKPAEFDCKNATTYGTGQLIADAIKRGAKEIIEWKYKGAGIARCHKEYSRWNRTFAKSLIWRWKTYITFILSVSEALVCLHLPGTLSC